jgi:hypothetical protein
VGPIVFLVDHSQQPTLNELRLLRSYGQYLTNLTPLIGVNTTLFWKIGDDAWVYRRFAWRQGPLYVPFSSVHGHQGVPLNVLLDNIEGVGKNTPQRLRWRYRKR